MFGRMDVVCCNVRSAIVFVSFWEIVSASTIGFQEDKSASYDSLEWFSETCVSHSCVYFGVITSGVILYFRSYAAPHRLFRRAGYRLLSLFRDTTEQQNCLSYFQWTGEWLRLPHPCHWGVIASFIIKNCLFYFQLTGEWLPLPPLPLGSDCLFHFGFELLIILFSLLAGSYLSFSCADDLPVDVLWVVLCWPSPGCQTLLRLSAVRLRQ